MLYARDAGQVDNEGHLQYLTAEILPIGLTERKEEVMIHFHTEKKGVRRWFYFAVGEWQPFKFLMHGGWFTFNLKWFKRYAWDIPKKRGWRWDWPPQKYAGRRR
jgi:hypothetical protein